MDKNQKLYVNDYLNNIVENYSADLLSAKSLYLHYKFLYKNRILEDQSPEELLDKYIEVKLTYLAAKKAYRAVKKSFKKKVVTSIDLTPFKKMVSHSKEEKKVTES